MDGDANMENIVNEFIKIAVKNQNQLKKYLLKKFKRDFKKPLRKVNGGLILNNNSNITLIAHLDGYTKYDLKYPSKKNIQLNNNLLSLINKDAKEVLTGDDRAGVVAILGLFSERPVFNVLFTEDEEVGLVGIKKMLLDERVEEIIAQSQYIIEIDKPMQKDDAGNFFPAYSLFLNQNEIIDNIRFKGLINDLLKNGFHSASARPTDVKVILEYVKEEHLNEPFIININAGYYNQHSTEEVLDIKSLLKTIKILEKFI